MGWARKTGSILGVLVGGVLAFAVLAYLTLVAVNWSDQAPSAAALRLTQLYENRPQIADAENAYHFMLGFSRARESERPGDVAGLARQCSTFDTACADALAASDSAISRWLESEAGLLERYGDLIARTGYREARYDAGTPMPAFSAILDGQTLLFIRAWAAADEGDTGFIGSALDDDLVFWRMVLADADILLTKMIAVAAVTRHFEMGNLMSRRLRDNLALPSSWAVELTDDERSMQRSLTGEWIYADRVVKTMLGEGGTVSWRILSPFWQPQDLSNQHAELMMRYINAFDVPFDSLPDTYAEVDDTLTASRRPFGRAYNLTGDLFMSGEHVVFGQHAVRVADLEGIRRAAVAAWRLRAAGVEAAGVESGLAESELSNPYTNDPFAWDGTRSEIVFAGLEPGNRGRHSLPY